MARPKAASRARQSLPSDGRARAVIEAITPAVDGGRFAVKRVVGDRVDVEADCFADGHDTLACVLRHRRDDETEWQETPMTALVNDRWRAAFTVPSPGRYRYTVTAWVDGFLSWRHDFARRVDADDLRIAARVGADLIDAAAQRASGVDRRQLGKWSAQLRELDEIPALRALALDEELAAAAVRHPDRSLATTFPVAE
ncbi:MAG: maltotransferase domain-containing protein [Burkholderiaceae bacterium]